MMHHDRQSDFLTCLVHECCFSTPSEETDGRPAPISTGGPNVQSVESTKELKGGDRTGGDDHGDADVRRKSNILFNAPIQSISPAHKALDMDDPSTGNASMLARHICHHHRHQCRHQCLHISFTAIIVFDFEHSRRSD